MKPHLLLLSACGFFIASCGNNGTNTPNGPIVLGDSSTIVTETDSQYLKDDMPDWEPAATPAAPAGKPEPKPAAPEPAKPDPPKKEAEQQTATATGYTISFNGVKMVFEGISANDASRQNPEKQDGLSYVVKSGDIEDARLHVYGVKNVSVKQRYQTRLMLSSDLGQVDLRNLGLYLSGWQHLNASGAATQPAFALAGLNRPSFSSVNNAKIKNATDKELRNRHTNHRTMQNWMKEIGSVRNANDKPCKIILDNVQFQVSGTGADGKPFSKNIRMSV